VSNCQDGCQTNTWRYDDLLSTDRVDLSNTYRVIVLVTGGSTVGHPSIQVGFLLYLWREQTRQIDRQVREQRRPS